MFINGQNTKYIVHSNTQYSVQNSVNMEVIDKIKK